MAAVRTGTISDSNPTPPAALAAAGLRSTAVPGCGFQHRPGACCCNWRRDAAVTRRRGRLRYEAGTSEFRGVRVVSGLSRLRCWGESSVRRGIHDVRFDFRTGRDEVRVVRRHFRIGRGLIGVVPRVVCAARLYFHIARGVFRVGPDVCRTCRAEMRNRCHEFQRHHRDFRSRRGDFWTMRCQFRSVRGVIRGMRGYFRINRAEFRTRCGDSPRRHGGAGWGRGENAIH